MQLREAEREILVIILRGLGRERVRTRVAVSGRLELSGWLRIASGLLKKATVLKFAAFCPT